MTQSGVNNLAQYSKSRNRAGHEILRERKRQRLTIAAMEAESRFDSINMRSEHGLIALAIMYWCEGIKRDTIIRFTNSDPYTCRTFIELLQNTFVIDRGKIRIKIHLHDYHDVIEMANFWSSVLNIPVTQFTKPYMKRSNHVYSHTGYKGCVCVTYGSAHIARVLLAFAKKYFSQYIT